jgi:hypothetical protein
MEVMHSISNLEKAKCWLKSGFREKFLTNIYKKESHGVLTNKEQEEIDHQEEQ